jgi:hypothetical protein
LRNYYAPIHADRHTEAVGPETDVG